MDKHDPNSQNHVEQFMWACRSLPRYADEVHRFKTVAPVRKWIWKNLGGLVNSIDYRLEGDYRWCLFTTYLDGLIIGDHMLVHSGEIDGFTRLVARAVHDIACAPDETVYVFGKKRERSTHPYFIVKLQSRSFAKTGIVKFANEILQEEP